MKLSKVFGIVLSLHVGVILLVMFQPSCQTTGGNTAHHEQADKQSPVEEPSQAFNQGNQKVDELSDPEEVLSVPRRPTEGEILVPLEPEVDSAPIANRTLIVPKEELAPSQIRPSDLSIYKVVRGDTLWGIAKKNNVTLASLMKSNPNLDKGGRLSIGQEIFIPSSSNRGSITAVEQAVQTEAITDGSSGYIVTKGDTLSGIARKNGIKLSALLDANGMSMSSVIRPGQRIKLPHGSSDTIQDLQPVPLIKVPSSGSTHLVRKGENLSRIASIYGISVAQIMQWNGLSNPSLIREGQALIISMGNNQSSPSSDPEPLKPIIQDQSVSEEGSLQDFFNDDPEEDRPIIDAP